MTATLSNQGAINNPWFHANLINAYTELGDEQHATADAVELLRMPSKFSPDALTTRRIPIVVFPRFVDEPAQGWLSLTVDRGRGYGRARRR